MSRGLAVRAVEVIRTPLARRASDHLPLLVTLELSPAARPAPEAGPVAAAGVVTGRP